MRLYKPQAGKENAGQSHDAQKAIRDPVVFCNGAKMQHV